MAEPLPMTLRVYRKLSFAMVPLSPALIKRRLKLGKEDPARVGERRGMSADVRPDGPLVWIHGASVGEVLAAAALIERLRGTESAHPADVGHGDVGGDRRQAVSARRHPSIRAVRLAALRRAVSRSLAAVAGAVHRIRPVAEPDPVERGAAAADGADQRTDVASLVSALAPGLGHHLGAARPVRRLPGAVAARCRSLRDARQPQCRDHRKSQARRSRAARRSATSWSG